jgi:hypothetical protein
MIVLIFLIPLIIPIAQKNWIIKGTMMAPTKQLFKLFLRIQWIQWKLWIQAIHWIQWIQFLQ